MYHYFIQDTDVYNDEPFYISIGFNSKKELKTKLYQTMKIYYKSYKYKIISTNKQHNYDLIKYIKGWAFNHDFANMSMEQINSNVNLLFNSTNFIYT